MAMKIIYNLVTALILGIASIIGALAQMDRSLQQSSVNVLYDNSIYEPLTLKEEAQILEVYGLDAERFVFNSPQRLKDIKNILRNRVEIIDAGLKDLSGISKLSEVQLFDDLVPNIKRDIEFNAINFNPLKYKFNFYSRDGNKYYRVDNTSFLIVIKSQYQSF